MLLRKDGARVIAGANLALNPLQALIAGEKEKLMSQGYKEEDALSGIVTILDFTLGSTFEEQAEPTHQGASISVDRSLGFERGIELIIAGLEAKNH
jgi:hypothetical protein